MNANASLILPRPTKVRPGAAPTSVRARMSSVVASSVRMAPGTPTLPSHTTKRTAGSAGTITSSGCAHAAASKAFVRATAPVRCRRRSPRHRARARARRPSSRRPTTPKNTAIRAAARPAAPSSRSRRRGIGAPWRRDSTPRARAPEADSATAYGPNAGAPTGGSGTTVAATGHAHHRRVRVDEVDDRDDVLSVAGDEGLRAVRMRERDTVRCDAHEQLVGLGRSERLDGARVDDGERCASLIDR